MSNTYNGWTNWDTWNANLWLTNEEGIYYGAVCCHSSDNLRMFWLINLDGTDGIDDNRVNWSEIFKALQEE